MDDTAQCSLGDQAFSAANGLSKNSEEQPNSLVELLPSDETSLHSAAVVVTTRRVSEALEPLVALLIVVLVAPVMVLIAIAVVVQDGGSPIFVQRRIGRGGTMFPCLKFRTMVVDAQAQLDRLLTTDAAVAQEWATDQKLRKDPRITPLGDWMRKTSLDELPQLFNVVAGHMNLVGPRPIVASEAHRYGRYFHHYCSVRPGLTGLWQVSGRSTLTYRRRIVLDTVYVRTRTLALDSAIMLRTIPVMLLRRGSA